MENRSIILKIINSILLMLIFSSLTVAQEVLIYTSIKNPDVLKNTKAAGMLELPFFDDFSQSLFNPDEKNWSDNFVFINRTYAVNPPSMGVATFDAVDNQGNFYDEANYEILHDADFLTSNPINLNYPSDNSIYLSFYFQAQGLADNPEAQDSLILEFYAPELDTWSKAWGRQGSNLHDFEQVTIQINEEKYLKPGFRFRFHNKVSLSGSKDPSKVGNCDHWHIDYVYLDRNRNANDTIRHDIAFVYPPVSVLKNYESMPWKHFLTSPSSQLKSNVSSWYQNNDNATRLIDSIYFVFKDNSSSQPNDTLFGGSYDALPFSLVKFDPPFTYPFLSGSVDSASFTIKGRFVTDGWDPVINNQASYIQKFYDYYAYDDGSAEAGYGLSGDGTQNAQLACKFDCIKEDTLKAIQFYFNRSLFNKNQKYFFLTIWDDDNGKPGQIIYQHQGIRPEFENELNKFHTYYIDDTVLVINRVFYVGWKQTTTDLLNIGFDFNRDHKQNNFYNIDGNWVNSKYSGSLMIRPFFGKMITTTIPTIRPRQQISVKLYPIPAKNELFVQFADDHNYQQLTISIYNLQGSLLHQTAYKKGQAIDLSGLSNGFYFIRLTDKTGKLNTTQKFIKQ